MIKGWKLREREKMVSRRERGGWVIGERETWLEAEKSLKSEHFITGNENN